MGSQLIRVQLRKILWENIAGNFLRGNLVGKACGKFLAGKSCGKILREISCGTRRVKANFRKAVIGGNLAFGIG